MRAYFSHRPSFYDGERRQKHGENVDRASDNCVRNGVALRKQGGGGDVLKEEGRRTKGSRKMGGMLKGRQKKRKKKKQDA